MQLRLKKKVNYVWDIPGSKVGREAGGRGRWEGSYTEMGGNFPSNVTPK